MRRLQRIVLWAVLIGVAPVVAGCADFDPDKLDVFGLNEKKKLPGDRRPVFPEGVPGVSQGIPTEYLRSNQQPPADAAVTSLPPEPAAAPAPAAAVESRPAPRRTVQRRAPAPRAAAAPVQPVTSEASPPPARATSQPTSQTTSQPTASGWPAPTTTAPAGAWPAPPASGTFTR